MKIHPDLLFFYKIKEIFEITIRVIVKISLIFEDNCTQIPTVSATM
jgi:hypothetical protein